MKNLTVDNVKQDSSLKELYRAYGYDSLDVVITCYIDSGASERSNGAIKRAIYRGDEKLKSEILLFIISEKPRKSQKFVDDIIKGFSNLIDSLSKATGMQRQQVVDLAILLFVFLSIMIISAIFSEATKETTGEKIKKILKEKNFKINRFAEFLYEEEFGSTGTEEEKNKFIQRVYKNLNDPNRNQATLQNYLNFACELEPMPS